jgi:hypothetical protein
MKILKAIGSFLFVSLLAIGFGLFLAIGVAVLALGDFFRFLGRRSAARMRGERLGRNLRAPLIYPQGHLVMDADGFVEPPPHAGFSPQSHYGQAMRTGAALTTLASAPRSTSAVATAFDTPVAGFKVLEIPSDSAARERLKATRKGQPVNLPPGGDKIVYLSRFLRSKKR